VLTCCPRLRRLPLRPPHLQQATTSTSDNDWELDPNEIIFHDKIASGAFGDLFRGSYCGQDVAIKILRNVHEDSQQFQEFLQVGGGLLGCGSRPAAAGLRQQGMTGGQAVLQAALVLGWRGVDRRSWWSWWSLAGIGRSQAVQRVGWLEVNKSSCLGA